MRLQPEDASVADWLPGFLHIAQYDHDRLDEAVVEFVDTVAHYLAYSGEAYFELVPGLEQSKFRFARLGPLPPGPVRRLPGRYLQMIPRADREWADGKRWNAVPADRMWRVRSRKNSDHHELTAVYSSGYADSATSHRAL